MIPVILAGLAAGAVYWSNDAGGGQRADFAFVNRGDNKCLDPNNMSWMQDIRIAYGLWEGLYTLDPVTLKPVLGTADWAKVDSTGRVSQPISLSGLKVGSRPATSAFGRLSYRRNLAIEPRRTAHGRWDVSHRPSGPDSGQRLQAASETTHDGRLLVLKTMGLAEHTGLNLWRVRADFEEVLRAMQRSADRQKTLAAHEALMSDERLQVVETDPRDLTALEGRILVHGLLSYPGIMVEIWVPRAFENLGPLGGVPGERCARLRGDQGNRLRQSRRRGKNQLRPRVEAAPGTELERRV